MPAQIIPQTIDGQTRYVIISNGAPVRDFAYLSVAAVYAIVHDYEVTL